MRNMRAIKALMIGVIATSLVTSNVAFAAPKENAASKLALSASPATAKGVRATSLRAKGASELSRTATIILALILLGGGIAVATSRNSSSP